MFARLYTRRSLYFNIALLLLLVVVWCVSYAGPVFKTFFTAAAELLAAKLQQ
jgi:hypothetical protein